MHRGAETSFDISADLREFARSAVITVCAGAKAILDMAKTLEVLETDGVPVVGFGTDDFPAFWSRTSGLKAPLRLDDAASVARFWATRKALGQGGGMLVANPVPADDEIPAGEIARHIEEALADAARERHRRQGGDALPAVENAGTDRRPLAGDQHCAGTKQRCRRRSDCGGDRLGLTSSDRGQNPFD